MSSQWEVVSKSRKHRTSEKSPGIAEQRKTENGPKLEEILPSYQVKTIFSNIKKNKNKEKKVEKAKSASPKKPKVVEAAKKQTAPPIIVLKQRNIESALGAISPQDLEGLLENLKSSFPGSELLWLKGVSSFLNSNLHIDTDPIFVGKSVQYPSNVIPKPLKAAILSILKSVGEVNLFYFFDQLLTGLAMDMSKNQPTLGYKILLQLIAQNWPQVCCNNLAKNAILMNSYQNRNSIGLSLLWSLGQGGFSDLTVGIKVWQNIMYPLIELKNYSRYVAEYIEKILSTADTSVKITLLQDEFFATYNALLTHKNIPRDCQKLLTESVSILIKKYIKSSTRLANIFLRLFKDIEDISQNQAQLAGCVECLLQSADCFKIWKMNYKRNTLQSLVLMKQISEDWEKFPSEFITSQSWREFLKEASQFNNDILQGRKKDGHATHLTKWTNILHEKSSQKKNSTSKTSLSVCPWICGSLLLIAAIGGLVAYDVSNHGGIFEKSTTGKFLNDIGALPYVEVAWYKTMSISARGYKWAEENIPIYYAKASLTATPYVNLAFDLLKILRNGICQSWEALTEFFSEKLPAILEFMEKYAPGLPKKIQEMSMSVWDATVHAYQNGCEFAKTKVFVGSFSPENLSKALNQTQTVAAQYYSWFHEKVDAYAKIK